jgi:hypothetical protein
MTRSNLVILAVALALTVACGCSHQKGLHSAKERKVTVGLVQKHIHEGVAMADVAAVLGSPNIVTRTDGKESWIYDKVAQESSYSQSEGDVAGTAAGATVIGGQALVGGQASGGYGRKKGAAASTQRTLTVVIRFDDNGRVEDYSYHASSF